MAGSPAARQSETSPPSPTTVEVRHIPPRVITALDEWIGRLITFNGGFGDVLMEINEGKVRRIRPTESWLADKL